MIADPGKNTVDVRLQSVLDRRDCGEKSEAVFDSVGCSFMSSEHENPCVTGDIVASNLLVRDIAANGVTIETSFDN